MKKILLSPITFLIWITNNLPEFCLILVIAVSILPFIFTGWHGEKFYTAMGGYWSFWSVITYYIKYKKVVSETKFYSILGIITLLLGCASIYFINTKYSGDHYTSFELFWTTYFGAMMGMISGVFIASFIAEERDKRKLEKMKSVINKSNIPNLDKCEFCLSEKDVLLVRASKYNGLKHDMALCIYCKRNIKEISSVS